MGNEGRGASGIQISLSLLWRTECRREGWVEEVQFADITIIQKGDEDGLLQCDSNEYILRVDPTKSKVLGLSNYKNIIAIYQNEEDSVSFRFGGRKFFKNCVGACKI